MSEFESVKKALKLIVSWLDTLGTDQNQPYAEMADYFNSEELSEEDIENIRYVLEYNLLSEHGEDECVNINSICPICDYFDWNRLTSIKVKCRKCGHIWENSDGQV